MQEYFEIGQIVNTSGLKGLVKVNLFTDDITKIEEFDKVISYAKENNLKLGKAVSKRIVTLIEGESKVRYDHLWVDLI